MSHRHGIRTRPRTAQQIAAVAASVREQVAPGIAPTDPFPVSRLAEVDAIEVEGFRFSVSVYAQRSMRALDLWAVSWWDPAATKATLTLCEVTWAEVHGDVPRSRWTVAHELGHVCLHRTEIQAGLLYGHHPAEQDGLVQIHMPGEDTERQANWFAAELLMPEVGLRQLNGCGVASLVLRYRVSERAVRIRLGELG